MEELENVLIECIPKIIICVKLFEILSECDRGDTLPKFEEFMTSPQER